MIVDLEEVRVKKAMKTVYSFRIQGTMSKSVVNYISCSLYSMRLWLTKITWLREVFSGQRLILYRGQIINLFFFFFFKPSVKDQFSYPVCSMIHLS